MPSNSDVAGRLAEVPGNTEEEVVERLVVYHRHIDGLLSCYKDYKIINADQPKADVFSQGMQLHKWAVISFTLFCLS